VRLSYGVKKHNFSSAPWCSGELYEYLEEHSVLTLMVREDIKWDSLAQLLENFPRLRVLLLETGYRADRYLFPLCKQRPNLYIDTSTYVAHRQLESFVENFGPEHLVFGSRLPLYAAGAALAVLATARISDEARLSIAGGTLRRLLGRESP
jgi:predicted TIM-barrel fold metal-dependent hydrolase